MRFFAGQYLPRPKDSEDPRASPLLSATLANLPSAVICTAEFDPLRDEGEAYADALKRAGVEVSYFREPGWCTAISAWGGIPGSERGAAARHRGVQGHAGWAAVALAT